MRINGMNLMDMLDVNNRGKLDDAQVSGDKKKASIPSVSYANGFGQGINGHHKAMDGGYTKEDICEECTTTDTNPEEWKTRSAESVKAQISDYIEGTSKDVYEQYEKMGIIPDREDPESFVTVAERIEMELIAHCEDYVPTGIVDMEDVKAMYGEGGMALEIQNALDMAKSLGQITPEMSVYLLKNDKALTLENVYEAQYSSVSFGEGYGKGYGEEQLSDQEWEKLSGQISDMLTGAGMDISVDTLDVCRFMVENQIPVTKENIGRMLDIQTLNQAFGGEGLAGVTQAQWLEGIQRGYMLGEITGEVNAVEQAKEICAVLANGTSDQVRQIIEDGKEVTVLTMKKVQQDMEAGIREKMESEAEKMESEASKTESEAAKSESEAEKVANGRVAEKEFGYLAQIQLSMSIGSITTLIRNGFQVQIASMQELSQELTWHKTNYPDTMLARTAEKESVQTMQQRNTFSMSVVYLQMISGAPTDLTGELVRGKVEANIRELAIEGNALSKRYEHAGIQYETMGTQVRTDLGDSLIKAFDNLDEWLDVVGASGTEADKRAIRILARNEMEMNTENFQKVKAADLEVSRLLANMTPKAVAYMVSHNINPLETDIYKLNDILDAMGDVFENDTGDSLGKYLWKLEKSGDLTQEERDAYMGLYRALKMIEQGDHQALGEVLKEAGTFTMQSLIKAARSRRRHIDVDVDDQLGVTQSRTLGKNNMDVLLAKIREEQTPSGEKREQEKSWEENRYVQNLVKKTRETLEQLDNPLPSSWSEVSSLMEENTQKDETGWNSMLEKMIDLFESSKELQAVKTSDMPTSEIPSGSYGEEVLKQDAAVQTVSESVIEELLGTGMTPTIANVISAMQVMNGKGHPFLNFLGREKENGKPGDKTKNQPGDKAKDIARDITTDIATEFMKESENLDHFDGRYRELVEESAERLEELAYSRSISMEQFRNGYQHVQYLRQAQGHNSYYVPVDIGGEQKVLHLTIYSGKTDEKRVDISMETEKYGNIGCSISCGKLVETETDIHVKFNISGNLNVKDDNLNVKDDNSNLKDDNLNVWLDGFEQEAQELRKQFLTQISKGEENNQTVTAPLLFQWAKMAIGRLQMQIADNANNFS